MGVSSSPGQLVAKLQASGKAVERAQRDIVTDAAQIVKTRVLVLTAAEIGGDLAFGKGDKGKRVNVRYKIENGGKTAFVKAVGPMHWLEKGVKSHAIVSKKFGRTRGTKGGRKLKGGGLSEAKLGTTDFVSQAFGAGAKSLSFGTGSGGALQFANGKFRPYARRAGRFSARRTWTKGVESSERPVRERFQRGTAKVMLAPFR